MIPHMLPMKRHSIENRTSLAVLGRYSAVVQFIFCTHLRRAFCLTKKWYVFRASIEYFVKDKKRCELYQA